MPGANLVGLTSVNDLVNQLVYDKVDAIVVDGAVAQQYAKSNSDLVVADVSLGEAFPYCVAVQKGDPKGLLPSINATIAKLIADGILRGAGLMKKFMVATFTDLILRVVLAVVLSKTALGSAGIWCAWPVGWTVATFLSVLFYKQGYWNRTQETV